DGIRDDLVTGVQTCALPILLAKDVGRLGRETAARLVAQDAPPVARLEEDRVGCHLEAVAVQIAQRLDDGGDEVGAAADRFGQDRSEERRVGKEGGGRGWGRW